MWKFSVSARSSFSKRFKNVIAVVLFSAVTYFLYIMLDARNAQERMEFLARISRRMKDRRSLVTDVCKSLYGGATQSVEDLMFLTSDKYKLAYCSIPKSGCTNMKRLLWVLNGKAASVNDEINTSELHRTTAKLFRVKMTSVADDYVKLLIVRHPFERLLSAYRNKLLPQYGSVQLPEIAKEIHELYANASSAFPPENEETPTFEEFVEYVTNETTRNRNRGYNEHWLEYNALCAPCSIEYDVIAHIETIEEDIKYMMMLIGAPVELAFPPGYSKAGKGRTTDLLQDEFASIPTRKTKRLYEAYYIDFLLFGYKWNFN